MTKILRDNKAVLTVVVLVLGVAMTALGFWGNSSFYPRQDGNGLKTKIESNNDLMVQKVDTHIKSSDKEFTEIKTDIKEGLKAMREEQQKVNKQIIDILLEIGKK